MAQKEIYISVDIEASGQIPGEFSMLSIGACIIGEKSKTFYIELQPLNDNFNPESVAVTGLSFDGLKESGEEPIAAMQKFEKWILEVSADMSPVLVGFNASFDWMFVDWYFRKFLGRDPFGLGGVDIKAYFMGMQGVGWNQTKKRYVYAKFPTEYPHTHNALDDALEQADIFEKMLAENKRTPLRSSSA